MEPSQGQPRSPELSAAHGGLPCLLPLVEAAVAIPVLNGPRKTGGAWTDCRKTKRSNLPLEQGVSDTRTREKKRQWKLPWIKITCFLWACLGFFLLWGLQQSVSRTHTLRGSSSHTMLHVWKCYTCANTCIQPLCPPCSHLIFPVPKHSACWEHLNAEQELPEISIYQLICLICWKAQVQRPWEKLFL